MSWRHDILQQYRLGPLLPYKSKLREGFGRCRLLSFRPKLRDSSRIVRHQCGIHGLSEQPEWRVLHSWCAVRGDGLCVLWYADCRDDAADECQDI